MTSLDVLREPATTPRRRSSLRHSREYRVIYLMTFPLFLAAAAFRRVTASSTRRLSLFAEARELASATIPMAFMG
jgi:hypothetical protein